MKGKYLCACPVCFYDTNGSRIDVRLLEQSPEQVDLRLTMRMCNRMGIATLIYHYVPDNTVYVIVFCDRIRQSFEYKEDTPFSPTISVSSCIEGFAASGWTEEMGSGQSKVHLVIVSKCISQF